MNDGTKHGRESGANAPDLEQSGIPHPPRLTLDVSTCALVMVAVAVLLALASLAGQYSRMFLGHPTLVGFVELFYVAGESTVPTWYSVSLLLTTSVALAAVSFAVRARGNAEASQWQWWGGLAALFLLLSMDDQAQVHEMVATIMMRLEIGGEGYLTYPWVIVGIVIVIGLAVTFRRFFWTLPSRTRWLFILGAVLFFGGAVGMEMVTANFEWQLRGADGPMRPRNVRENPFSWQVLTTIEELLEMLGIVAALYATLDYFQRNIGGLHITLASGDESKG